MSAGPAARRRRRQEGQAQGAARWFTIVVGLFLLVQGAITLTFLLVSALDEAVPWVLDTAQMVETHSVFHIATGLVALGMLRWGGERGTVLFAVVFGAVYVVLAVVGLTSTSATPLGLEGAQDPIHVTVGLSGLLAAYLTSRSATREGASP